MQSIREFARGQAPRKATTTPENQGLFFLNRHINRLLRDAQALGISTTKIDDSRPTNDLGIYIHDKVIFECRRYISENPNERDTRVRILLASDGVLMVSLEPYILPWEKTSISVITFTGERPYPQHKTCFTECSESARAFAVANGADEAFLKNSNGQITEGAWTNIFWINSEGQLHTSSENILPGITREILLEKVNCNLVPKTTIDELIQAKEVFVTQATTGITPVHSLNGINLSGAPEFCLTKKLQDLYNEVIVEEVIII